jgi:hypothetical protein
MELSIQKIGRQAEPRTPSFYAMASCREGFLGRSIPRQQPLAILVISFFLPCLDFSWKADVRFGLVICFDDLLWSDHSMIKRRSLAAPLSTGVEQSTCNHLLILLFAIQVFPPLRTLHTAINLQLFQRFPTFQSVPSIA